MSRYITRANGEYLMCNSTPVTGVPLTICAWARAAVDMSGNDYCIVQIQDSGETDQYFRLCVDQAVNGFAIYINDGVVIDGARSGVLPNVGDWYFVTAISRSSTNCEILVNGESLDTDATDITPVGLESVAIGREMDSSTSDSWDGDIAEVGIWNTALTLAEIRLMATGYPMALVRPQNLTYWPLRNGCDFEWHRRYDMTPYNTPTISPHPPKVREYWNKMRMRATATQGISRLASWGQPNEWNLRAKAPAVSVGPFLTTYGGYSVPVG